MTVLIKSTAIDTAWAYYHDAINTREAAEYRERVSTDNAFLLDKNELQTRIWYDDASVIAIAEACLASDIIYIQRIGEALKAFIVAVKVVKSSKHARAKLDSLNDGIRDYKAYINKNQIRHFSRLSRSAAFVILPRSTKYKHIMQMLGGLTDQDIDDLHRIHGDKDLSYPVKMLAGLTCDLYTKYKHAIKYYPYLTRA